MCSTQPFLLLPFSLFALTLQPFLLSALTIELLLLSALALELLLLPAFPFLLPRNVVEALALQRRQLLVRLLREPLFIPFAAGALLLQIRFRERRGGACRREVADVLRCIGEATAFQGEDAQARDRVGFLACAIAFSIGMVNLVAQIADGVHPSDICPAQHRECAAVMVDHEGDVGEVDQAVGRRAGLERLQPPGIAALVALARLLVEHL